MDPEAHLDGLHELAADLRQLAASLDQQVEVGAAWSRKDSAYDIFSPVDSLMEERVAALLAARYPGDGVRGEEGLNWVGDSGRMWIVDPIDGTVNYVKGDRTWGISVARHEDGIADCSVVVFPKLDTEAVAARGLGAYVDGRRIGRPGVRDVADRVIATKFGNSARRRREHAALIGALLADVRDVRRSGCSSWDIVQVALGVWDGYLGSDVFLWDYAGSALVLEEAGGRCSEPMGRTGDCSPFVVAATAPVHDWLVSHLEERFGPSRQNLAVVVE